MGYKVKIQRVDRGATKSFYVNFPAAVAEASKIEKVKIWNGLSKIRTHLCYNE